MLLMTEIGEIIARATKMEEDERWGGALLHYAEAIRLLDEEYEIEKPKERAAKMSEEDKHVALDCWIGYLRCRIRVMRADSESFLYDMGKEIGREIKSMEEEVEKYRIGNKVHLWNRLQRAYDQLEEERRVLGRKNEADALHSHMLRARMKRDFWRIFG
jgi:hypothetical protein